MLPPAMPNEFLPRLWAPHDATDGLAFWLTNPMLLHHYGQKMALTVEKAAGLTENADKLALGWKLREMAHYCRTRLAIPQTLPTLERPAFSALCLGIEDRATRQEVHWFGAQLHVCELPWLAARIEFILAGKQLAQAA